MAYTQPMVYKINAFDVNDIATIPELLVGFTELESPPNVIHCVLDVYNNDTGNLINDGNKEADLYLNTTSEDLSIYICSLSQPDPDNPSPVLSTFTGLDNGNSYYITVTLPTDVTGGDPIISNGVIFSCYSKPNFIITSMQDGDTIKQNALKINFTYNQINNVELNWYQCDLYLGGELVNSSGKLYDENYSYTFQSLINGAQYSFIVSGSTIDNFNFESNIITFNVNYQVIQDSALIKLENVAKEGYIKVNSNLNSIPGIITNSKLENSTINLVDENSNMLWNENVDTNGNPLTIKLWCRDFKNNKKIIDITNSGNTNEFVNIFPNVGDIGSVTTGENIKLDGQNVSYISYSVSINDKYFGIYNDLGNRYVVYSADLINWYRMFENDNTTYVKTNLTIGNWMLGYINGYYYIQGTNCLYYSDMATSSSTWNKKTLSYQSGGNTVYLIPTSVTYNGSEYFWFGYNGYAKSGSYNFDDATVYEGANYNRINVIYSNNKYIGINSNNILCYSVDGENWGNCVDDNGLNITFSSSNALNTQVLYYQNKYILCTPLNGKINTYNSIDGITWKRGDDAAFYSYYQSYFLAKTFIYEDYILSIGYNNTTQKYEVYYSYDGTKWNLLFVTSIVATFYGVPIVEVVDNALYINTNVENIFSLIYSNISFTVNAKGVDNNVVLSVTSTPLIGNVVFNDWLYIGAQIILDNGNPNLITNVEIVNINQHNNPGGI